MKFLIVDDDPLILKITAELIRLQGHDVFCCETALEAMHSLHDLTYDILITDVTMPIHSGFDLIRSIRKKEELSYLTIAILTGRSAKRDIQQAVELGIQDYIVKPIEPELFIEKMEKLAQQHKKTQHSTMTNAYCEMLVPTQIIGITDKGIHIESPYPLLKGTVVTINLPQLQKAGILSNRFQAISNSANKLSHTVITELILLDLDKKAQLQLEKLASQWRKAKAA